MLSQQNYSQIREIVHSIVHSKVDGRVVLCIYLVHEVSMKIFVCIKQVPDTETRLKVKADNSGIDETGIKWVMNPYDEFAVEEALKLKESQSAEVTVITVGPMKRTVDALRTALAMGADDAIAVDAPDSLDTFATAKVLAAAIQAEGQCDLILTGKLAIDDNAASVCQMLAEFLKIPHCTVVTKLEVKPPKMVAERETEGGTREIIELHMPAVLGANKGLNLPRYASLPGIMKAKKKPIKEVSLAALGLDSLKPSMQFTEFKIPADKPAVKMMDGDADAQAKQLVKLLHEEAKVL